MSFTCPACGAISHNQQDREHGYCGRCHDWTAAGGSGRVMYWVLDADHNAVPGGAMEWERQRENHMHVVDYTEFHVAGRSDPVWVSTVFLGIDHSLWHGPPVLFETMVFAGDDMSGLDQRRYCTYAEAEAGHREIVAALMARYLKASDPQPAETGRSASIRDG